MKWAAGTHKAAVSPTVSAAATIAREMRRLQLFGSMDQRRTA